MSNYIKVRATVAVAGMWAGSEYEVDPENDFIEQLLSVGHLVWVDKPQDETPVTVTEQLDDKLAELDAADAEPVEEKPVSKTRVKFQTRQIDGEKSPGTIEA